MITLNQRNLTLRVGYEWRMEIDSGWLDLWRATTHVGCRVSFREATRSWCKRQRFQIYCNMNWKMETQWQWQCSRCRRLGSFVDERVVNRRLKRVIGDGVKERKRGVLGTRCFERKREGSCISSGEEKNISLFFFFLNSQEGKKKKIIMIIIVKNDPNASNLTLNL